MITNERLTEIESAPREACIFKSEAEELVSAYRALPKGLRLVKDENCAWLHITAPSGKETVISVAAIALQRGPLVRDTVLEWMDAL